MIKYIHSAISNCTFLFFIGIYVSLDLFGRNSCVLNSRVGLINFENFFIFDFLNHADSNGISDCYPQTHGLVRNSKMGPDQSMQDSQVFQELIPNVV